MPESAHSRGTVAVAEVLRANAKRLSEHGDDTPPEVWLKEAGEILNAYLRASNPVGQSETIYDDYHRIVAAARELVEAAGPRTLEAQLEYLNSRQIPWELFDKLRDLVGAD